jgi:hypothetical protein
MKRIASSSTLMRRLQAMADATSAMRARGCTLLTRWPRDAAESGAVGQVGAGRTSCA